MFAREELTMGEFLPIGGIEYASAPEGHNPQELPAALEGVETGGSTVLELR